MPFRGARGGRPPDDRPRGRGGGPARPPRLRGVGRRRHVLGRRAARTARLLLAALEACRQKGLHVAVDTCGAAPREVVLAAAARADLLLWDVKTLDPERHRDLTGVPLEPILANLAAVSRTGVPIWLRLPIVPGVSDDPVHVARAVALAERTSSVARVSLLPFHRTANGKRERLGKAPTAAEEALSGAPSPAPERMAALAALFAPTGLTITIGG